MIYTGVEVTAFSGGPPETEERRKNRLCHDFNVTREMLERGVKELYSFPFDYEGGGFEDPADWIVASVYKAMKKAS